MRSRPWIALLLLTALAAPAAGARAAAAAGLHLPELEALAAKADEVVEVDLDADMLALAGGLMADDDDPDLERLVHGLRAITVRSFTFAAPGAYDPALVGRLRQRLVGPGWKRVVNVRTRDAENVEIYVLPAPPRLAGLVILAAEPTELTVVHLEGDVDLADLDHLQGRMGVPDLGVERTPEPEGAP